MSNNQHKMVAIILTGGKSQRMGKDKSTLKMNAQTMLERTIETIKASSITQICVSGHIPNSAHPAQLSVEYIEDIYPNKGPLSGIHSAISRFRHADLLVVPVDLPLLDANTLQVLIQDGYQQNKILHYEQSILPLYIPANLPVFEYLENQLAASETSKLGIKPHRKQKSLSLRQFASAFAHEQLQLQNTHSLFNVNTPQDWQEALLINKAR